MLYGCDAGSKAHAIWQCVTCDVHAMNRGECQQATPAWGRLLA